MIPLHKRLKCSIIASATLLILSGLFSGCSLYQDVSSPSYFSSEPLSEDILSLDMEIGAANIQILSADELQVQIDNPYIEVQEKNGCLIIHEKSHIANLERSELILLLPEDLVLENVQITTGAGQLFIESLHCRELALEIGAGSAEIQCLNVQKSAQIEGGTGEFILHDGTLNNLDFEMGLGRAELFALLKGHSEISAGIGSLALTIPDTLENYTILAEAGIGSITADGMPIRGKEAFGSGDNRIELEGGIGKIALYFEP